MTHSLAESKTWDGCMDLSLDIPTEETYQLYLISLHYRTLEYENYSARFTPSRAAKLQWFATDMAVA
ncbi:hypothetical protein GCM10028803_13550 [Larkinella knui]|uniref:Uncharacterized protein n=1 Tax=Larkinella knui TaxID=2025310 RepID=A0A3P1CBP9_9BACT|nr:hypothetical protein [Larkinella knui]RRB10695.1 hypothetical protein EHT87_26415 [Larkinella knui]